MVSSQKNIEPGYISRHSVEDPTFDSFGKNRVCNKIHSLVRLKAGLVEEGKHTSVLLSYVHRREKEEAVPQLYLTF